METQIVQIRSRGTLTLPVKLRERYDIAEGDPYTLVDLDGVMVLTPKLGAVPKLTAEIEGLREERGLSLEDLTKDSADERPRSVERRNDG